MNIYHRTELYMYRYKSNMRRLDEIKERLREEEMHGDVKVQKYGEQYGREHVNMGAEDWYVRCEVLRARIRRLERITEGITELMDELADKGRYLRRYEVMLGIMEKVYIEGMNFREYLLSEGIPERTGYRRRRELVMKCMHRLLI